MPPLTLPAVEMQLIQLQRITTQLNCVAFAVGVLKRSANKCSAIALEPLQRNSADYTQGWLYLRGVFADLILLHTLKMLAKDAHSSCSKAIWKWDKAKVCYTTHIMISRFMFKAGNNAEMNKKK